MAEEQFCAKKGRNSQASVDQQPAKTATMHCHPLGDTHLPRPVPPFLLVQNLSFKWIAPTDNMQSKFHDEYSHHQLLMG